MTAALPLHLPSVVCQHHEEADTLFETRCWLLRAPHVDLHALGRLDERLAAHVDGLLVAGDPGKALCVDALDEPGTGRLFIAGVVAIACRDTALLDRLLSLAETDPALQGGVESAFGWVSASSLRGVVKGLLDSASAFRRGIGLQACALHGVDPGPLLPAAFHGDESSAAAAAHIAGRLGRLDLLSDCLALLERSGSPRLRFAAARAALLLGERSGPLTALGALAASPSPHQGPALDCRLRAASAEESHGLLKAISTDASRIRLLIRGMGVAGDPHYIPWLIKQMETLALSRLAGESFSLITGLNLSYLERETPDDASAGPSDDPGDDDVSLDEDEGLPWPDLPRISAWWSDHGHRFVPGQRHFLGGPLSEAQCFSVLAVGFQRQRAAAAEHLCLLSPGRPLFDIAAPAWRQRRLLASTRSAAEGASAEALS
jgi:uncharacterized protein (TIGR02270 family)